MASKHELHRCDWEECMVCNGGLAACEVCGGAEGSLPSECPERQMTADEQDLVYSGELDFVGGRWVQI